jgi:hypothetical protein
MLISYERRCRIIRALLGGTTTRLAATWPTWLTLKLLRESNAIVMNAAELRAITRVIRSVPRCRLLVFGVGYDSAYWVACNRGGTTCFVEHDTAWANQVATEIGPDHIVVASYGCRLGEWCNLVEAPDRLTLDLPPTITGVAWDVIVVDGPPGLKPEDPGRMQSIHAAAGLAARPGHVFVHDCDREVEQVFSDRYLGGTALRQEVARLRHYELQP